MQLFGGHYAEALFKDKLADLTSGEGVKNVGEEIGEREYREEERVHNEIGFEDAVYEEGNEEESERGKRIRRG